MKTSREEIKSMLDDMNEAQLQRVLDYVTNEYDEENFEEHVLRLLKRTWAEVTLLKLRKALEERADISEETLTAVKEESDRIMDE